MSNGELLQEAARNLYLPGKRKFALWKDGEPLMESVKRRDFLEQNGLALASLIVEASSHIVDSFSRSAVEGVLRCALKSDVFLKTAASVLVKYGSRIRGKRESYYLLKWTCWILQKLSFPESQKAISKILEAVGNCLDGLATSEGEFLKASKLMNQIFDLDVAFSKEAIATGSTSLIRVVSSHLSQPNSQTQGLKSVLLDKYVSSVLGAKTKPTEDTIKAYQPLLCSINRADFAESVLPAMLRYMRRNPEIVLEAAAASLKVVNVDMSAFQMDVQNILLQFIRHTNSVVQEAAIEVQTLIAKQISDRDVLNTSITVLYDILSGKSEGRIKNVQERAHLTKAIKALASSPSKKKEFSSQVTDRLSQLYKQEGNDEVKIEILSVMGTWLKSCNGFPDGAIGMINDALGSKESLRNEVLSALAECRQNAELFTNGASLVPALCKSVENGLQKAANRPEGIAAFLVLSLISSTDPNTDSVMEKSQIWKQALAQNCPFFDPAVVSKLPETASEHLSSLCQNLLLVHVSRVDGTPGCLDSISRAQMLLCLNGSKSVAKSCFASINRCLGASASLMQPFLDAFGHWQKHPDLGQNAAAAAATGDIDAYPSATERKQRFGSTLKNLVSAGIDGQPKVLTSLLLRAHHPLVQLAKKPEHVWNTITKHSTDILPAFKNVTIAVIDGILGASGLLSEDPHEREAALASITTTAKTFPDLVFNTLVEFVPDVISQCQSETISENDLLIWNTPEDRLSTESHTNIVIVPDEKKKQTKKKPKGRYRHDKVAFAERLESSEEEELELERKSLSEQSKSAAKGKKAGHLDAAERQMMYRAKQLAEEMEVRERVSKVKNKLEAGLGALTSFVKGNYDYAANHLDHLGTMVMPLLTSPLVGEGPAFEAAKVMAKALPHPMNLIPTDIAVVLRLIYLKRSGEGISMDELLRHGSMLAVMHGIAAAKIQGGPSFQLVLPILQLSLQTAQSEHFQEALKVLVDNCAFSEVIPRPKVTALLFEALATNPASKAMIDGALEGVSKSVQDNELHALLSGLSFSNSVVRSSALSALAAVSNLSSGAHADDPNFVSSLLIAAHDTDESNSSLARQLFASFGCSLAENILSSITPYIGHQEIDIRSAAAGAIGEYLEKFPHSTSTLMDQVLQTTTEKSQDKGWLFGSALTIETSASYLDSDQAQSTLSFLMTQGLTQIDDVIRGKMVTAGLAVVNNYDPSDVDSLFQLIDNHLASAKGEDHESDDRMREGAVVLLGSVAQHLNSEDSKVENVVDNLLDVLSTPSESVQRAASTCLSPLIQKRQANGQFVSNLISIFRKRLATGDSYGMRRGASYGLAGLVKGLGISSIRQFSVMEFLKELVEDKSNASAREGGICAYDCLSQRLGKLFEPYAIQILPLLLTSFGDSSVSVRQVTSEASRTIMQNLTGPAVKQVLRPLVQGLEDKAWRTKQGSIQLLGTMAWLSPKQLSACLATIVPKLIAVLADPHPKVHAAAEKALEEVGTTIRNPEIQQLVPDLLGAIAQPTKNNVNCLERLLESQFLNTIDASSLALIIPVVHRGLKDRTGENKKKASRIVQNLCKLVNDPKDMDHYTALLLPELKRAIVDPLPDVRAQSSKALSSLMFDLGKKALDEVVPWLIETLESNASSVERLGAAQALAELLAVFGSEYLEELLPHILKNCSSTNAILREGGIGVLRFLPYSMPEIFQTKLVTVLPYILDGLADENESVRDISLTAGRTLVDIYAQTSLPLILPAVEQSLFHENWRIRQSSVELLGNLFFKVAGTSGKVKLDGDSDDDGPATQSYGRNLITALGMENRNSVLAKLYMSRCDVQHPVRTAALHIWKTVVVNTPKTLMEVLPSVMDLTIEMLAFGGEDGRQTAGQCLGELVKKMGDRVLPEIIPILERCFQSESVETREGVCYGLRELLDSLTSSQLADYLPVLLPTIQGSLCDPDKSVREVSAVAFDALFKAGPSSVVDSVVPDLLHKLESEQERAQALEGLRVILSIRPHTLGTVLPKLLKEPVNVPRIQAIASLAEVAAGSLKSNLPSILRVLLKKGSMLNKSDVTTAAQEGAVRVAMAIPDENLHLVIGELRKGMDDATERYCSAMVIASMCGGRSLTEHLSVLLQTVLSFMSEDDPEILQQCWKALSAVGKSIPKESHSAHIRVLKDSIDTAKEKQRRKNPSSHEIIVPGFCLPRALDPILPLYLSGINQGTSAELRELSAEGLGELVNVMDASSLKPFVFQIIGPLIKISGERFPWQIKLAILKTMGLLIRKAHEDIKKFVSALQPIFMKALQDPTSSIRECAAQNLGQLSFVNQRVDQLVTNLVSSAFKMDAPLRNAYLCALSEVFVISGDRVSNEVLEKTGPVLEDLIRPLFEEEDDVIPLAVCLGTFCKYCSPSFLTEFLTEQFSSDSMVWMERLFTVVIMAVAAKHCPSSLHEAGLMAAFHSTMNKFVRDDKVPIKKAACRCAARLIQTENSEDIVSALPVLVACLGPDQSTELQEEGLKSIQMISHGNCELLKEHLNVLVPLVCALAKECSGTMKMHCETTLALVLDLEDGFITVGQYLAGNPGATAKSLLVDPYLRRIQKFNKPSEFESDEY